MTRPGCAMTATEPAEVQLDSRILDAAGNVVEKQTTPASISPGETTSVVQDFAGIENPQLWSPSTPYLYRMVTVVRDHGAIVDTYRVHLRLPVLLLEQSGETALPEWQAHPVDRYKPPSGLSMARRCCPGLDADPRSSGHAQAWVTTSSAPRITRQTPAIYDFCDRNGIIVTEESPNIKDIDFGRDVQKQMLIRDDPARPQPPVNLLLENRQ